MEKYKILLAYFDKQLLIIKKNFDLISKIDLKIYDKQFVFTDKVQKLYTAIEDLFKQIAKRFENHIDSLNFYHKELLIRMTLDIANVRPKLLSDESFKLLDKFRSFRHFLRHAYDCEYDENELRILQERLIKEFHFVERDLRIFREYIQQLSN